MFRMIALCVVLSAVSLSAATITLHNTGVNASDVVQSIGSVTSFWTLTAEPAGASEAIGSNPFRYFNGSYYVDNSVSGWVSPANGGNAGVGGFYTYSFTFDLTGFNAATAVITGTYGTDNDGSILLNGNTIATTAFGAFGSATAFTMNSGFLSGLNTISVRVDNGGDPTAFRVEFTSGTVNVGGSVPEPSTLLLMMGGLAVIGLCRTRFSKPTV
jgi:PEP-CTERM motif-containing protein